jgi:hypothetical protein
MILSISQRVIHLVPPALDFVAAISRSSLKDQGSLLLAKLGASVMNLHVSVLRVNLPHVLLVFSRIAGEASLDPAPALRRLDLLLRTTDVCERGDWAVGMALVDACGTLLARHNAQPLVRPLGELLLLVETSYSDLDVRDAGKNRTHRSGFYNDFGLFSFVLTSARWMYLLLTNIAGDNLQAIVGRGDSTSKADFSAGSFLAPAQPFPRAPAPEPSIPNALALARDHQTPIKSTALGEFEPCDVTYSAENYSSYLDQIRAQVAVLFPLKLSLGSAPQDFYCILVKTAVQPGLEPVEATVVPALGVSDGLPRTAPVLLSLRPIKPQPFVLQLSAEVSLTGSRTSTLSLPPIPVSLRDLCQPVPLPPSAALQLKVIRAAIFDTFWMKLEETASIRVLHVKHGHAERALQALESFIVRGSLSLAQQPSLCMMMWVPPSHHILLQISIQRDKTVANIRVDSEELLTHVDKMVTDLCKEII